MLRVLGRRSKICNKIISPSCRSLSFRSRQSLPQVLPKRKIWPVVLGISTFAIGGGGIYLYRSSSLQILEFAKEYTKSPSNNLRWRDAIATALIDICSQEQGRDILLRHHWGSTLGSWIVEDSV